MMRSLPTVRRADPVRALAALGAGLALLAGAPGAAPAAPADAQSARPSAVDLNTASPAQLEALPGIGEVRARAIVAHREAHGGFASVDQLADVKGVGERLLEALRPHVTVSGR